MQPRLNTVTGESRLFNLHPMVVINLSCIPTAVCRDAAKIEKSVVVLKEETRGGRYVGWDVGGAAGSPRGFAVLIGEESSLVR